MIAIPDNLNDGKELKCNFIPSDFMTLHFVFWVLWGEGGPFTVLDMVRWVDQFLSVDTISLSLRWCLRTQSQVLFYLRTISSVYCIYNF